MQVLLDTWRPSSHASSVNVVTSTLLHSRLATQLRTSIGTQVVDAFFRGASQAGRFHPKARRALREVELVRDLDYVGSGKSWHRLDVTRPRGASGPLPTVLYVHGGGFRILSKDTHWLFSLLFARENFVVFSINYRLAPQFPFPAAIEDAAQAYSWVVQNAASYGADPSRLVLAGESAGGNLVLGLALAACWKRQEPWAKIVYDTEIVPRVVVPMCGMLQVSDVERFDRKPLPWWVRDRIFEVRNEYLPTNKEALPAGALDFADPLVFLERATERPSRPLPAVFASVGTKDILLDDTRRLEAAWSALGATTIARYYQGEPHAFQPFVNRQNARDYWAELFPFLRGASQPSGPSRVKPSRA